MWILNLERIADRQAHVAKLRGTRYDALEWRLRHTRTACVPGTERVTLEFVRITDGVVLDWCDADVFRES